MSLSRFGLLFAAPVLLGAALESCPSHYPVRIAVYEHAPDPVLMSAERGQNYQGVAGRTYSFHVTSAESGRPEAWIEYAWHTDTGRSSPGLQPLPADGMVAVTTEVNETWLQFEAGPTMGSGEQEVKIELRSPDSPGAQHMPEATGTQEPPETSDSPGPQHDGQEAALFARAERAVDQPPRRAVMLRRVPAIGPRGSESGPPPVSMDGRIAGTRTS